MNTWDVVTVRFPFADGNGAKQRPAVVVSKNEYHSTGEDGLFLLITSNIERQAKYDVPILTPHSEFKLTGLIKDSCVRVDKVMFLRHSTVCRVLGNLGPQFQKAVREKLRELWEI